MYKCFSAIGILILSLLFPTTATAQDGKKLWKDVLRNCATNDIIGSDVLYVGPTNNLGLGSIWRKVGSSYHLVRDFDDAVASKAKRAGVVNEGSLAKCSGDSKTSRHINPTFVLQSVLAPISGSFGLDLKKARTVTVSVDSWTWDQLKEGDFLALVRVPPQNPYLNDLRNRLVVGKALRISGLKADLEYAGANALELAAKYKNKAIDAGAGLKAEWTNDNKMHIEANSPAYLVFEMYKYTEGGFQGESPKLAKVPVAPTATAAKVP